MERTYFLDVTGALSTSLRTGIQGVASNIIQKSPTDRFTFVKFTKNGFRNISVTELQRLYGSFHSQPLPKISRGSVNFQANDILLVLDLHLDSNYLDAVRQLILNDVDVRFYVHDVLPLTHKKYFPATFSDDFLKYIQVVGSTKGFACSTESTKSEIEFVLRKYNAGKFGKNVTVPIGVNIQKYTSNSCCDKLNLNADFLLCVSNFEPRKNHIALLDAFEKVHQGLKLSCVFVGGNSWMSEDIWKKIKNMNDRYGQRVFALKDLNPCCLSNLYQHSKFTVYLSSAEGYGMPILESVFFNKPVLIQDLPPMNELTNSPLITKVKSLSPIEVGENMLALSRGETALLGIDSTILPSWEKSVNLIGDWLKDA